MMDASHWHLAQFFILAPDAQGDCDAKGLCYSPARFENPRIWRVGMAAGTANGHESAKTDIREHLETWHGFLKVVKWGLGLNLLIMIFLAIFRTHG